VRELYQVVEVGPSWYQDNIPCQEACPVKTNCRGYLNLAAAGEFEKAWELALDPNPMASICGSVCAAPCETACRRKEVDKPLSIGYVNENVELRLSTYVGRDVTLKQLHDEYDAVLVTAGCFEPNYPAEIKNLDADGV